MDRTSDRLRFALLDAARAGAAMQDAHALRPDALSLYKGMSEESLSDVAPFLFPFERSDAFGRWLVAMGRGRSWGVFLETGAPIEEIHRHLRKFLTVRTEASEDGAPGKELYFRFYDPRVLRIFLETCSIEQLGALFGPVERFVAEDEDPRWMLLFSLGPAGLESRRVSRDAYFAGAADVGPPNVGPPNVGPPNVWG